MIVMFIPDDQSCYNCRYQQHQQLVVTQTIFLKWSWLFLWETTVVTGLFQHLSTINIVLSR